LDHTPLWLQDRNILPLTTYASNLNATMLDRRENYGVIQGTF
jgi:hypothetical protein